MPRSELSQRVGVAAVGIPLVVAALYLGRWAMGPVLALFCAGAALELYRLAEQRGVQPLRVPGATAAVVLILTATIHPNVAASAAFLWTVTMVLVLATALAIIWSRGVEGKPLLALCVTVVGAILPAGAFSYAIFLRHMPAPTAPGSDAPAALVGLGLVAYPLAATWLTDSAAYFAGKRWGRRKLIPTVSPGKTREGAAAGLLGGMVGGLLMALILDGVLGVPLGAVPGALGGLGLAIISQAGDLAESVWKREAGVKDSGTFFPGHGGFLDRMDSLLFTIPAAYWWLALVLVRWPEW